MESQLRGAVAQASNGSLGIIYKEKVVDGEPIYVGISFRGNAWSSRQPVILAHSIQEYVAREVEKQVTAEKNAYLNAVRRIGRRMDSDEAQEALERFIEVVNERAISRRDERRVAPRPSSHFQILPGPAYLDEDEPDMIDLSDTMHDAIVNSEDANVK